MRLLTYVVGLGFICFSSSDTALLIWGGWIRHTFLLPPVRVTFTNRRVYVMRFFARPLGVFFFSWGSTY